METPSDIETKNRVPCGGQQGWKPKHANEHAYGLCALRTVCTERRGEEPTLSTQPLSLRDLSGHRCWGLPGPGQDEPFTFYLLLRKHMSSVYLLQENTNFTNYLWQRIKFGVAVNRAQASSCFTSLYSPYIPNNPPSATGCVIGTEPGSRETASTQTTPAGRGF